MTRFFLPILVLVLLSAPAWGCPVCFDPKGGSLNSFRFSTIFLSLLPLGTIGFFYLWVRRKLKDSDS